MAAVSVQNAEDFVAVVRRSMLVDSARLDDYLHDVAGRLGSAVRKSQLAQRMVEDGLITRFQALNLLSGKTKGYFVAGKYKVLEMLGAGGMGKVFLCEHVRMKRLVALKILP